MGPPWPTPPIADRNRPARTSRARVRAGGGGMARPPTKRPCRLQNFPSQIAAMGAKKRSCAPEKMYADFRKCTRHFLQNTRSGDGASQAKLTKSTSSRLVTAVWCDGANSPLLVSIDWQGGQWRLYLASWNLCAHVAHGPTLQQQAWRCGFDRALAPLLRVSFGRAAGRVPIQEKYRPGA